jgi:hypothetical protein
MRKKKLNVYATCFQIFIIFHIFVYNCMKLVYEVTCADMFLGGNVCFRLGVVSHRDEYDIYMPLLST